MKHTITAVEVHMTVTNGVAEDHRGEGFTVGELWWRATSTGTCVVAYGHTVTGESTNATFFADDLPGWMPEPPAEFTALAQHIAGESS